MREHPPYSFSIAVDKAIHHFGGANAIATAR